MHKEYILLNGFRKAKKGFTAGFHVPLSSGGQHAGQTKKVIQPGITSTVIKGLTMYDLASLRKHN